MASMKGVALRKGITTTTVMCSCSHIIEANCEQTCAWLAENVEDFTEEKQNAFKKAVVTAKRILRCADRDQLQLLFNQDYGLAPGLYLEVLDHFQPRCMSFFLLARYLCHFICSLVHHHHDGATQWCVSDHPFRCTPSIIAFCAEAYCAMLCVPCY